VGQLPRELLGLVEMVAIAPESCANTVFEVPIVSIVGNRV
jgi:hypothetical protein